MQELFGIMRMFSGGERGGIDIQKGKTVVGERFGGRWQLDAVPKATCGGRIQSGLETGTGGTAHGWAGKRFVDVCVPLPRYLSDLCEQSIPLSARTTAQMPPIRTRIFFTVCEAHYLAERSFRSAVVGRFLLGHQGL